VRTFQSKRFAKTSGFTLIELLIAISLLAVVSALCWRGLDALLKTRDRLNANGDELKALTLVFAQMDEDLRRTWAMRAVNPAVPAIRFSQRPDSPDLQIDLLREGGSALDAVRAERVSYRLKEGVLERGYAPYVAGGSAQAAPYVWQTIVTGPTAIKFKAWVQGQTWQSAEGLVTTDKQLAQASVVTAANGVAQTGGLVPAASIGITPGGSSPAVPSNPSIASGLSANLPPPILGVEVAVTQADGSQFVRVYSVRD
jgi:general secretion pathway protein J